MLPAPYGTGGHRPAKIGKRGARHERGVVGVRCARAGRFWAIEQREIERILLDNQEFLLDSWAKEKAKRANN